MYYPGLDLALALLYLLVLVWEAGDKSFSWRQRMLIIIVWQLPAWFLSLTILMGMDNANDFSNYYIFMLQLWHTPLLPLTTLLSQGPLLARPLYYYAMFLMAPLLAVIYLLPLFKKNSARNYKPDASVG